MVAPSVVNAAGEECHTNNPCHLGKVLVAVWGYDYAFFILIY